MKKLILCLSLSLVTLGLWAEDWMKADWYATKKQVVAKMGVPVEDNGTFVNYQIKVAGIPMESEFHFKDQMLQSIFAFSDLEVFDKVLEALVNEYGRPQSSDKADDGSRGYTWRRPNFWIRLVEFSGSPFGVQILPRDTTDPDIVAVRKKLSD